MTSPPKLEARAQHKSDRKHVRHGATPHDSIEGLPLQRDRARDNLQTHEPRRKAGAASMAATIAKADHGCEIRRRN